MADFNSLTADQQAQLASLVPLMRSSLITMSKAINLVSAINSMWGGGIGAANDSLDAGALIPDNTGLAGAVTLTKEDLDLYIATATALLAAFNTPENRTLILRAVGAPNVV